MSRVVPKLRGVFRVFHQNNRFSATKFPRDYTHVASIVAESAQDARNQARADGDRNATYEGGMSVPRRETLPGDVIIGPEGLEFMVFRDYCRRMPGLSGRPQETTDPPHVTTPPRERER